MKHAERLKNVVLEMDRRRARKSLLPSSSRRADRVTGSGLGGRGGRGPGLGGSRLSREEADQSRPAKRGVAELPGVFACVRGRMNVCPGRLGGSLYSEGDGARRAPSDSETPCSLKCVRASRACGGWGREARRLLFRGARWRGLSQPRSVAAEPELKRPSPTPSPGSFQSTELCPGRTTKTLKRETGFYFIPAGKGLARSEAPLPGLARRRGTPLLRRKLLPP